MCAVNKVGVTFIGVPDYASVINRRGHEECAVMGPVQVKNVLVMEPAEQIRTLRITSMIRSRRAD
jgi:hypothetical protein